MSSEEKKTPLEDFVRKTIEDTKAGMPSGFRFASPIEFKLRVVTSKEGSGGVAVYVVDVGGKYSAQEVKEVTFSITDAEEPSDHIREAQKKLLKKRGLL